MNAVELSGWLDGKKIDIPVSEEMYLQILKKSELKIRANNCLFNTKIVKFINKYL